jgi:hypothetical protein
MAASQQLLAAIGSGVVFDPQTGIVDAEATIGNSAIAQISFGADGSIAWLATPTDLGTGPGDTAWYDPVTSGIGSSYWIRFTATAGTLTVNTASTFTSLSSAQSCSKSGSTGTSSATVTAEIATDSGGTNIVYTMAGILLRYSHV